MARTQTMVQLTSELIESLDAAAAQRGMSRSALIREFVLDALEREGNSSIGDRIAAGYQRIPQTEPDDWGDLGTTADVGTEELLLRLDDEERRSDARPW